MKFKTLFFQSSIFILLFGAFSILIFELPPRLRNKKNQVVKEKICYGVEKRNINFIYSACPNTYLKRDPGPDFPEMQFTESWLDNFGMRKPFDLWKVKENFNTQKIFIIGDSFIQADEIPYEKTIYGLINSYSPSESPLAYGMGFGSWNPIQYRKAIQTINKKNVTYDIFLFSNDFNPSESRSVYSQIILAKSARANLKNKFITFISRNLNKSFTYKKLKFLYKDKILGLGSKSKLFWDLYYKDINKNKISCDILKNKSYNTLNSKMKSYVAFSLPSECWNSIEKASYSETINEINNLIEIVSQLNSEIRILLIPPGWSFKDENTLGRSNFNYNIPAYISFSYHGLRQKLKQQYGNLFYDLEPYLSTSLEKYKSTSCAKKNCKNVLYFSNDGHLNERSHRLLFDYLYKEKIKSMK